MTNLPHLRSVLSLTLFALSLTCLNAQESEPKPWTASASHGPPKLCVGEIKDGSIHLQVARPVTVTVEQTYVVDVPYSEMVGGKVVTRITKEARTRSIEQVQYQCESQVRSLDSVLLSTATGQPMALLDDLEGKAWRGLLLDDARVLDEAHRPFFRDSNLIIVGSADALPTPKHQAEIQREAESRAAKVAEARAAKEAKALAAKQAKAQAEREEALQAERQRQAEQAAYQQSIRQQQQWQRQRSAEVQRQEYQRRAESLRRAAEQEAAEEASRALRDFDSSRYYSGGGY